MYKLTINGQTYYEELDFSGGEEEMNCDSNSDKISLEYLAEPKPIKELPEIKFYLAENINLGAKITLEQLNILLNISASQRFGSNFSALNQYSKLLAMKVFSISDKNIFNISLQSNDAKFANAIIYLTNKFDQRGKADYNQSLTLCINNQEITSQDILPIDESLLLGLPNIST